MPKLHPIVNDMDRRRWCGPSAVCAITGWPMSAVHRAIKSAHPNHRIAGTHSTHLFSALKAAGYTTKRHATNARTEDGESVRGMTVARWMRTRRDRNEVNLLGITYGRGGHWIVVAGNKACDSQTGEPVNLRDFPHRRKRVKSVRAVIRERRVARPQPVQRRRLGPRAPAKPYRAGYILNDAFVPVHDWDDRHVADRMGSTAEREGEIAGAWGNAFEHEEGTAVPVVIQRKRDGRYTRHAAFGNVCDGLRQFTEIEWYNDPAEAAAEECR